jgi:membrane-bound lytic murein transglycosylase F
MVTVKQILILFILLIGCSKPESEEIKLVSVDMQDIMKRGKLIALTGYSATSYFIYRGQPMGYEYELLSILAKHLNLELEIKVTKDIDNIFNLLNDGEGDILAYPMAITNERKKLVTFAEPHLIVSMVLIQRLPDRWYNMKSHRIEKLLIINPIDLIGKKVYVRRNSSYYSRLLNMSEEIGGDIDIITVPGNTSTEELIRRVADGKIDFTVADENIALINKSYFDNIDIKTPISFPQQIAWAVRHDSPELLKTVNEWLISMKDSTNFYVIYNKYFKNQTAYKRRVSSEYYSGTGGKISAYDSTVIDQSKRLEWDWRLLSSMIYQESHFDPNAESWAGAVGLMQLMPNTAREFGATDRTNPTEGIKAGVNYLIWLNAYWRDKIHDDLERRKFVMGSYNVGYNHVNDARRLAEKYELDMNIWDENVAYYLLKKSSAETYNDEVVAYGYCRGSEPVKYVKEINDRYQHYLKLVN